MTATLVRMTLALLVAGALVGTIGLAGADTESVDAGDRLGDTMPYDHGEHHSGEHHSGEQRNGEHAHGEHHDGNHHSHGEHHQEGPHC